MLLQIPNEIQFTEQHYCLFTYLLFGYVYSVFCFSGKDIGL